MTTRSVLGRAAAALVLMAGISIGILMIAPAGAHVDTPSHLWAEHLKAKADARYLQNTTTKITGPHVLPAGGNSTKTANMNCPSGSQALGAAWEVLAYPEYSTEATVNTPLFDGQTIGDIGAGNVGSPTGWRLTVRNSTATELNFYAAVICSA